MSYDFAFWHSEKTMTKAKARTFYSSNLDKARNDSLHPSVSSLIYDLEASAEEWASDYLIQGTMLVLYLPNRLADDALPRLWELVDLHNLVTYDPQWEIVMLPSVLGGNWRKFYEREVEANIKARKKFDSMKSHLQLQLAQFCEDCNFAFGTPFIMGRVYDNVLHYVSFQLDIDKIGSNVGILPLFQKFDNNGIQLELHKYRKGRAKSPWKYGSDDEDMVVVVNEIQGLLTTVAIPFFSSYGDARGVVQFMEHDRTKYGIDYPDWREMVRLAHVGYCYLYMGEVETGLRFIEDTFNVKYSDAFHREFDPQLERIKGDRRQVPVLLEEIIQIMRKRKQCETYPVIDSLA